MGSRAEFCWQPISEYMPDHGHVLLWLSWPVFRRDENRVGAGGCAVLAYQIGTASGPVWVTAHDSIPCETTGRKATHFIKPRSPDAR